MYMEGFGRDSLNKIYSKGNELWTLGHICKEHKNIKGKLNVVPPGCNFNDLEVEAGGQRWAA